MKLRRTAVIAGAAVVGISLAACAGGASGGTTGGDANTVTFRSWSPVEQTTQAMIAAFTEANPDTTIDATIFNYPEYIVDLQTRASSGTMPDIVGLQPGALTQQYRDYLMPLQDCAVDTWGDDWQSKFYPIGIDQARMGNPDGDENFYALPILTQTVNLWANTEILDAKGVAVPTTWDELTAATTALQGESYAPFLLPAKDSWLRNVVFLQIANNIAPGLVYEAEDGTGSWTDPQIVEAFDYWGKLFTDGIAQDGAIGLDAYPSGANQFEAGNAAMIPLGAWWIQQSDPTKDQSSIPPLSVGMEGYEPFLFPTIPGGAPESQFVGGIDVALGISKDSANPDLACKVLTDFIAGEGAQKLVDTMNDVPAVTGLAPSEFTSDKQEEIWNTFVNDWLPQVQYSRYFKDPALDQAVADALAAVATGDQTPEEAAASVQAVQDSLG
ncbi:ABC transporter substrate-binding protein [Herbiconiux sp. L3-i23]|uniref:ABC transporter substrate-binding protein n=1 Tax=Herbiconiux sp. L3-i23 TaxID=2905871 RepID=UPI0020708E6D|nr:extracellular solute-binding protein [Herbiconiux sp. L3-i23]BDI22105.1 ABC transporter substrate-binding protein [Herbiconiux sp. L3-i23]